VFSRAAIPLTYYYGWCGASCCRGIGIEYLWPQVLPLLAFGFVVFTLSILRFRKQLDELMERMRCA